MIDTSYSHVAYAHASDELARLEHKKTAYRIAKRAMDLLIAGVALIVLSPVMLLVALAVKLDSKGPVFYTHKRVGKNGKELKLYKFRSMFINAKEMMENFTPEQKAEFAENFKLRHDPRITRVGKFIRRTSLDELPQLVNILKGELSIVGPRPVVEKELEKYGEFRDQFLSVTPGLTGYWQAYSRSDCTYEERISMELHYVRTANFLWDIKIIIATFRAVIKGHGAR